MKNKRKKIKENKSKNKEKEGNKEGKMKGKKEKRKKGRRKKEKVMHIWNKSFINVLLERRFLHLKYFFENGFGLVFSYLFLLTLVQMQLLWLFQQRSTLMAFATWQTVKRHRAEDTNRFQYVRLQWIHAVY